MLTTTLSGRFSYPNILQTGRWKQVGSVPKVTSSKWQSWDLNPSTGLWMSCSEIPPLQWGVSLGEGSILHPARPPWPQEINGCLLFSLAQNLFTSGEQVAAPKQKGCGGR